MDDIIVLQYFVKRPGVSFPLNRYAFVPESPDEYEKAIQSIVSSEHPLSMKLLELQVDGKCVVDFIHRKISVYSLGIEDTVKNLTVSEFMDSELYEKKKEEVLNSTLS